MTRATFEVGGLKFEVFRDSSTQTIMVYAGQTPVGVFTGQQTQELCTFLGATTVSYWREPMFGTATNNEVKEDV